MKCRSCGEVLDCQHCHPNRGTVERIAELEAALREAVEELTTCERMELTTCDRMLSGETYNNQKFNDLLGID